MIQLVRGFRDLLPGEVELWQEIERIARCLLEDFGFKENRIPLMEKTELFARSIGEDTDIVEKEMYTFTDRGGDMLTLRPEATASVVRSYIQHRMHASEPVRKFYTIGPMFRRERPQKGRYRQFYQINAEILGVQSPHADAQLIHLLNVLFSRLSVTDVAAHVNSLGCPECRPGYKAALTDYITPRAADLCEDCRRRSGRNPLRTLDCKVPRCREIMTDAPDLLDHLCPDCQAHFKTVRTLLDRLGVPYALNKRLVRGLDYYTRTTFEILTGSLGAQSAVAGGGRYDGLIEMLGGPPMPAIGFAIGFDRLAEISGLRAADFDRRPALYVAALGEACRNQAFEWICALAGRGIYAEMEHADKSLKSQMKRADRLGASLTLLFGEEEARKGIAILRNMATRDQIELPLASLIDDLIGRITP